MDQTLNAVLAQLTGLKGVNHASIYSGEHGFYSTIPEEQQAGALNASELIALVFATLRSVDKTHNEVYLEFDDGLITVYELPDSVLVLLSTDKKINFPMVGMGVKAVSATIRKLLAGLAESRFSQGGFRRDSMQQIPAASHEAATRPPLLRPVEAISSRRVGTASLRSVEATCLRPIGLDHIEQWAPMTGRLKDLLVEMIGSNAEVIYADCLERWQADYAPIPENVPFLAEMLSDELDSSIEKMQFNQRVAAIRW
ncbi:MAG: hypothetical protein KJ558_09660 [Gammaproteobacteria bacterium]|nr:hypothetical protein [Gammaproteobacteria bacterium]MBU1655071.1 hypothetical protein [Gammaproteobacteria bacterium]MBU1961770.1 hypothetical protein [Gammaproteobacteria bacterium]